jgi:hypothetical protein
MAMLWLSVALIGCASTPSASRFPGPPAGLRRAELIDVPYTRLIDFEIVSDLTFIDSPGSQIVDATGGTGSRVLDPGSSATTIRLSSLLLGRAFPDRWNLLGVYVSPGASSSSLRLTLVSRSGTLAERMVQVPGGSWSIIWIDIAEIDPQAASELRLVIDFGASAGDTLIDDVVLADNLVRESAGEGRVSMEAVRSGLRWRVTGEGSSVTLPTHHDDARQGYRLVTLTPMRATFRDGQGQEALVDRRGRVIVQSHMQADALTNAQHTMPGRIVPLEESATTVRNSPGDQAGDGYDEAQGVYRLRARREIVRFNLQARGAPLAWPMIEIDDLPPGEVRATADGVLVHAVERLADGRVLIELPVVVQDSAGVEVKVVRSDRSSG